MLSGWLTTLIVYLLEMIPVHVWFYKRRHYEPIKSREWELVLAMGILLSIFVVFTNVGQSGRDGIYMPCMVQYWAGFTFLPFFITPLFIRSYILYYRCVLSELQLSSLTPEELDKHWVIRYRWTLRRGVRTAVMIFSFVITMLIAVALHFLLPSTPANFASTLMGVDSCRTETEAFIIADSILCLLGMPAWLVLLWNVKDSYQLKMELKLVAGLGTPIFVLWAVNQLTPLMSTPPAMWIVLLVFVVLNFMMLYPIALTYQKENRLRKGASSASRSELSNSISMGDLEMDEQAVSDVELNKGTGKDKRNRLAKLLEDPAFLASFRQFCAESWCVENLLFYLDAIRFSTLSDEDARRSEAGRIFRVYFTRDSPLELNVDSVLADGLKQQLANANASSDIFDALRDNILLTLYEDVFRRYRATEAYAKYDKRGQA